MGIKRVRPDGKIDLTLTKPGFNKDVNKQLGERILDRVKQEGGYLAMNDRTDPETIKSQFGVSKRAFKIAIGGLYKQRLVAIEEKGIRLL